jgi:bifunctional enzyme CysN/CysC
MPAKTANLVTVKHRVSTDQRVAANKHQSGVLWFTGLPGSGKSTLAIEVEQKLFEMGWQVYVLDGDNVRQGLSADLGFSPEDRTENIRRIGEMAALFADAGFLVITAFISPYRADRDLARKASGERFHEIHIAADVEVCEDRDPKGHYARARAGEIKEFTGVSAPYEPPAEPEFTVDTASQSVDESVSSLMTYIEKTFSS